MTIEQALQLALQHHNAGRMAEAESIYRQVLSQQPDNPAALHLLGVLAAQAGHLDAASDLIRKAIALCPTDPLFYSNLAGFLSRGGAHQEAIALCREALQRGPEHPDVYNNLAVALAAVGELDAAIANYRHALRLKPEYPAALNCLGLALRATGRLDEAIEAFQNALRIKPDFCEAYSNLGLAFDDQGRLDDALAAFQEALRLNPDFAEAHCNLGLALEDKGQVNDALAAYRKALQLMPDFVVARFNLGNVLAKIGKADEAIAAFKEVLRLNPDFVDAHINLGRALGDRGYLDAATIAVKDALRLKPDSAEAYSNLGVLHERKSQWDDAIACYRTALQLKPDFTVARFGLGNVLGRLGNLDEAIACYRETTRMQPELPGPHGNLLYTLHFHPDYDARRIFEEHQRWNREYIRPLAASIEPHANDRHPDRRLRVGFVSPDFRDHPVGRFIAPLFSAYDRKSLEIFCYSDARQPGEPRGADAITDRLRRRTDHWRSTVDLKDAQLAALIRQDRIDILIDLIMHMEGSRLPVFGRKPAPVQVTYLAYCASTGLETIDYRLTDRHLDPPSAECDAFYSEKSVYLETYWCYPASPEAPPLNPLPAQTSGHITFGSLNNFSKVSPLALQTWAQLLRAVPGSRLLLYVPPGSARERVKAVLAEAGVEPARCEFVGFLRFGDYFRLHHHIDIALDPFPYAGGTTTCDALWMGVPVITLSGSTAVGRAGVSLLSTVGLPEFIAQSPQDYIRIAGDLARDIPRLTTLRSELRERMRNSPLMDAPRFARNVDAAFREMWKQWCAVDR